MRKKKQNDSRTKNVSKFVTNCLNISFPRTIFFICIHTPTCTYTPISAVIHQYTNTSRHNIKTNTLACADSWKSQSMLNNRLHRLHIASHTTFRIFRYFSLNFPTEWVAQVRIVYIYFKILIAFFPQVTNFLKFGCLFSIKFT